MNTTKHKEECECMVCRWQDLDVPEFKPRMFNAHKTPHKKEVPPPPQGL